VELCTVSWLVSRKALFASLFLTTLEAVNVVVDQIFGLISPSCFKLGEGSELLILGAELVDIGFLKGSQMEI
jgi:hypothetical protein